MAGQNTLSVGTYPELVEICAEMMTRAVVGEM